MENKNLKPNEEIDILYFFKPVTNLIEKIAHSFKRYIENLKQNKFLFFSIIIIITLGGYSMRYFLPKSYKVEGIFVSRTLPASYCSIMLGNLTELLSGNNLTIAARELGISTKIANEITAITLTPLKGSPAKEDTTSALFTITLMVTETDHIDSIQKGIITYLEKSEYAKIRKEAKIKSLNSLKSDLQKKIVSLDSVKNIINSSIIPRSQGEGIILGEPINPVSIYQAESAYYRDILKVDEDLAVIDNIEVVQPFLQRNNYNYPNFNRMLIRSFAFSFLLALVITPGLGKRKKSDI